MPDRAPGEAVHDFDAEACRRAGSVFHLPGGAAPNALRVAVAPYPAGQNVAVARVDPVAHRLADQVIADGVDRQTVPGQQFTAAAAVVAIGERRSHVEVISPAGELEAVVPPCGGLRGENLEGQVGPLSCEECDRAAHPTTSAGRSAAAISTHSSRAAEASTPSMKRMPRRPSAWSGKSWSRGSASTPAIPAPITLPAFR